MKMNDKSTKSKKNKASLITVILVVFIAIGIFVISKIRYNLKPDAVIEVDTLDVNFKISGFDGLGKITAEPVGSVKIKEIKNLDLVDNILKSIKYSKIALDKSENLKNGDTVKATFEVSCPDYKVDFDKTIIEREYTIENLPKLINDFSDIQEEFLKEFEEFEDYQTMKFLQKGLSSDENRYSNVKITKFAFFDRKMTQEDTDEMVKNGETKSKYALILVNHFCYDYTFYPGYTTHFDSYSVVKATNFEYVDGKIKADFIDEKEWMKLDQLVAGLNFNGFGLAGGEVLENKKYKIEKLAKSVDGKVNLLEEESKDSLDFEYEIIDEANLRELPSLEAPVVLKLNKFNYPFVTAYYKKETPDGRTWYYVHSMGEEDYNYSGWISDRVIQKPQVG